MAIRVGIGDLLRVGPRAVAKYTGTVLAVFVVQSLVALACMLAIALILSQAFGYLPMFDDAVDGDLVAIVWCLRHARPSFLAISGVILSGVLFWQLASWFLAGGLYGVLAQRPENRGETARCFGASGASTYLAYARLAMCALPGWVIVLFLLAMGMGTIAPRLEYALTLPQLFGPIVLASLPGLLVLHFLWTVNDYARVELTLRHDSHDPGVIATYLRTVMFVIKRPVTWLHALLGWVLFALVTVGYAYLAQGHPMYGASGAVLLLVVRQGVSLLRFAIKVGMLAGQVELGRTRALPPRRLEVKVDANATDF